MGPSVTAFADSREPHRVVARYNNNNNNNHNKPVCIKTATEQVAMIAHAGHCTFTTNL